MTSKVDAYFQRSKKWPDELRALRPLLLGCGLTEDLKWGKPCYAHEGANILILQEMNAFLALMFFKGALMNDPERVLAAQGPNSRAARRMEFTSARDVVRRANVIKHYVKDAIRVEADGLKLAPAPQLVLVDELRERLAQDGRLKAAFAALTPGRQREYNMHVAAAKQTSTRSARVDRCAPKILAGKGFRD